MSIFNQRRLSENLRPISPTKRKLALFEGMGGNLLSGLNIGSQTEGSAISGGPLKGNPDGRTHLLSSRPNNFPFPGSHSSQDQRTGQVRWVNNAERPYRFSFYSNALPSTIHARSLAEIPGEGQTFEDLFIGRRSTSNSSTRVGDDGAPRRPGLHVVSEHLDIPTPNITTHQEPLYTSSPGQVSNTFSGSIPNQHDFGVLTDAQIASAEVPLHHNSSSLQLPQQQGDGNKNQKPRSGVLLRTDEDAEASTWWLDVLSPTDQEMKLLSKVFGIHPLTTEDIQMEETREKIELFRNYYLVCFRSFDQDPYSPTFLEPLNIYIIVFREGTLSFHFRATPHPQNVRRRIKQLKDYINVTSDWVSYALIDDITDAFGPLIQSIEYEVDSIDELVLILKDVEQSDMLRRIGTCRKKVMGLLRLMGNKADVVKGLAKRCNENWLVAPKSDIGLYLSDIQDHLVTMTQNLNHYEKILSRSHSNYLAQISIEMTDANNQINDVLSKLTALGSILVPMNLVTGLWGMNVHVPGQDITEGYAWFIAIVSGLVSFGVIGAWLTLRYLKFSNR